MTKITSVFDLPEKDDQLSSTNQGLSDLYYDQIQALSNLKENGVQNSNIIDKTFGNVGTIDFRWQYDSSQYWIPARSYMHMRCELSQGNDAGNQLEMSDNIAPAMGCMSGLFSKIIYKINSSEISTLSENISQIDAFKKRLYHSGNWLNDVGSASNFYQARFTDRQKQVIANANEMANDTRYLNLSSATQAQIFSVLDVAADSLTWDQNNRIFTITDAALNNLKCRYAIGDVLEATINGIRQKAKILNIVGFGPGVGGGTILVDTDFGPSVPITVFNVLPDDPNFQLYYRAPLSADSGLTNAQLFPNLNAAADTIGWQASGNKIVIADVPAGDLLTTLKAGDYLEVTIANVTKIAKVLTIEGFSNNGGLIQVDNSWGNTDIAGVAFNNASVDIKLFNVQRYESDVNRNVRSFEIIWQPPLSIFNCQKALPALGINELEFTVETNNYKKYFIESQFINADDFDNGGTDYKFRITDMFFRVCKCTGDRLDNRVFKIDLDELHCQRKILENPSSTTQTTLTIQPSTNGIALAFQDISSGSDTRYSLSKFKIRNDDDMKLERYYIRYCGIQKPQPDGDPEYGNLIDNMVQEYVKNLMYSGAFYDSNQEKIDEWRIRGPYLYFPWPKSGEDTSDRVSILTQFKNNITVGQVRLLVFNFYKRVATITIENSRVIDVQTLNA
jgi:hypothetical protein